VAYLNASARAAYTHDMLYRPLRLEHAHKCLSGWCDLALTSP
jgi:hypothetical protein